MNLKIFKLEIYECALIKPKSTELFEDLEKTMEKSNVLTSQSSENFMSMLKDKEIQKEPEVLQREEDLEYDRPNHVHYFTNRVELGE